MSESAGQSGLGGVAKEIFLDLLDLPREQREEEIEKRTAHDPDLRAAVVSLLEAHERAGQFLHDPTVQQGQIDGAAATIAAPQPITHRQIGPYKILQEIGEGGFGTVYLAEQERPVRRRVALKVIKIGMDTKQVIARFEAERQALAMMDHPSIAKVFDAGTTPDGRPFFAMELVSGVPITEFCDKGKLDIPQRLELFGQVCQAVQHAHQKGIIHRDIKPSNILVNAQDDRPLVKVIDFGIAKATQARLTEKTLFTEFRQLIGTPEYMSPEQAEGSLDIDTRTDVYALGVLLYELLTGTTPFDARELRSKAYGEMQRVIREVDPPRPSTRLSSLRADMLPSVAAHRSIEPRRLGTIVRGELDWIVMKALEKDRSRRYDSANGLGADVQRFLADEPVGAGPPSRVYRARKFARRHKVSLGAGAAMLVLLVGGLIGTTWGLVEARRERARVVEARDAALAARDAAEQARRSEAEAREYERQTDRFLKDLFTSIDPQQSRGRDVLVRDILDRAVQRIEAEPPAHKVAEGSLRFVLGRAYQGIGMLDEARIQYERAMQLYRVAGADPAITDARAIENSLRVGTSYLGTVYRQMGRPKDAEAAHRESLDRNLKAFGADHHETIRSQLNIADVLELQGRFADAAAIVADAFDRVKRNPSLATPEDRILMVNTLASLNWRQGRPAEAERLFRDALAEAVRLFGEDHPNVLGITNNLANVLREQGRLDEASQMQQRCVELARRVFGIDHPDTLTMSNNLGLMLDAAGRCDDAEQVFRDTIERRTRVLGRDAPATLIAQSNLALALSNGGRLEECEPLMRDVLARMQRVLGADHPATMLTENNLAWLLLRRGRPADAEAMYAQLCPRVRTALGAEHPQSLVSTLRYAQSMGAQEKWTSAEPLLAEAHKGAAALGLTANRPDFSAAYGLCLMHLGRPSDARPLLEQADAVLRRSPRRDAVLERQIIDAMIQIHEQLGPPEQADAWRQRRQQSTTQPGSDPQ